MTSRLAERYTAEVLPALQKQFEYPNPNQVVGTMNTNPSWFFCKMDNQAWVGGPHPNRWIKTVADNGKLGWMKDTAIFSETDPLRDC